MVGGIFPTLLPQDVKNNTMGHAAVNFSMDCDEDDELGFVIQNCINSWDHDGISNPPNGDTFEDIKMSGKHSFKSSIGSVSVQFQVSFRSVSGQSKVCHHTVGA